MTSVTYRFSIRTIRSKPLKSQGCRTEIGQVSTLRMCKLRGGLCSGEVHLRSRSRYRGALTSRSGGCLVLDGTCLRGAVGDVLSRSDAAVSPYLPLPACADGLHHANRIVARWDDLLWQLCLRLPSVILDLEYSVQILETPVRDRWCWPAVNPSDAVPRRLHCPARALVIEWPSSVSSAL